MEEEQNEISALDEAKQVLAEIKKENADRKALILKAEKLQVEQMLSGKSNAGAEKPALNKNEEIKARVNTMLQGTGYQI